MLEINLAIVIYDIPAIRALYATHVKERHEKLQRNSFHEQRLAIDVLHEKRSRRPDSSSNTGSTLQTKGSYLDGGSGSRDLIDNDVV